MNEDTALASRLYAEERSDEAHRRDILKCWHRARDNGLSTAAAADSVGVSRAFQPPIVESLSMSLFRSAW